MVCTCPYGDYRELIKFKRGEYWLRVSYIVTGMPPTQLPLVIEAPAINLSVCSNCNAVVRGQGDARPSHRTLDRSWIQDWPSWLETELTRSIVTYTKTAVQHWHLHNFDELAMKLYALAG